MDMDKKLLFADRKAVKKVQCGCLPEMKAMVALVENADGLALGEWGNAEKTMRRGMKAARRALSGMGRLQALDCPMTRPRRELKAMGKKVPEKLGYEAPAEGEMCCALQLSKQIVFIASAIDNRPYLETRELVSSGKDWRRCGAEWLDELTIGYPVARAIWLKWGGMAKDIEEFTGNGKAEFEKDLRIALTMHNGLWAEDTPSFTFAELKGLAARKLPKCTAEDAKGIAAAIGGEPRGGKSPFDERPPMRPPEWVLEAARESGAEIPVP